MIQICNDEERTKKRERSAYYKAWYQANKDKKAASVKSWRENNLDKCKAYAADRRAAHLKIVQSWKNKPCADCGIYFHPEAMQFDHLRDKEFNISHAIGKNLETLWKEFEKCEVVCANGHALRTRNRRLGL